MAKRVLPAITHNGYKVLSQMPTLIYYLQGQFPEEFEQSGLWPADKSKELQSFLEWYQNNLRPNMKEYYGFIVAKHKIGLETPQDFDNSDSLSDIVSVSSSRPSMHNNFQLEQISKN